MMQHRLDNAEDDCTRALAIDSSYVKAWFRRGSARFKLGKYLEVGPIFIIYIDINLSLFFFCFFNYYFNGMYIYNIFIYFCHSRLQRTLLKPYIRNPTTNPVKSYLSKLARS